MASMGIEFIGRVVRSHVNERGYRVVDEIKIERAETRLPTKIKVPHAPERDGSDGLGYGNCVVCGELWPCPAARDADRP